MPGGETLGLEAETGVQPDAAWLFSQNLGLYTGEWVAVLHRSILAHGRDLKEVYREAMKKSGADSPLFYSIPVGITGGI